MVKLFLKRLFFCLLMLVIICGILFIGLGWYVRENLKLKIQSTTLILGNSHPECALDDRGSLAFKNLARSAEPLYYTQFKLKWLLKWNPQIKRVFVELSENQLESRMEDWIWSDESIHRQTVSLYPFLSWKHHLEAIRKKNVYYILDLLVAMKRCISGVFLNDESLFFEHLDWGGFEAQEGVHFNTQQQRTANDKQESLAPYVDNLMALQEIVELAKEFGVEIKFIRCPYHPRAKVNFEKSYLEFFTDHPEWFLLDFRDFVLPDDCFFDEYHLNAKGAAVFTQHFNKMLLSSTGVHSKE